MNEELQQTINEVPEPEVHKKPLLLWLARSIFIDTILEFFRGIIHFFAVHIKLILFSFRILWLPANKGTKEEVAELMDRCQAVFGFLLTILGILIFLVKINVLEEPDQNLTEAYGNERTGLLLNITFFLILAVGYYIVQAILVLLGRLYQKIMSPLPNNTAYDMLFISMGNQVFILGAVFGLMIRMFFNMGNFDAIEHGTMIWLSAVIIFLVVYLIIMIRLLRNQVHIPMKRRVLYGTVVVIFHGLVSSILCYVLGTFFLGV